MIASVYVCLYTNACLKLLYTILRNQVSSSMRLEIYSCQSKTFRREYVCSAARLFNEAGSQKLQTAPLHIKFLLKKLTFFYSIALSVMKSHVFMLSVALFKQIQYAIISIVEFV